VDVDRDATTVVIDGDAAVDIDRRVHLLGMASHALVDRVVDHLVDQVMEPTGGVVADIHPEPLADMVAVGEVLEIGRRVFGLLGFIAHKLRSARVGVVAGK
jgi:hypothetical protein